MKSRILKALSFGLALVFPFIALALAADEEPAPEPAPSVAPTPTAPSSQSVKKRGQRRGAEKETEGTEAKDRFQADTVIKSKYEYNGKPLEADPD